MKKTILLTTAILLLCSCSSTNGSMNSFSGNFSVSYTDASGYTTSFSSKPERVAVLFSSYAQIWSACGGEISVTVGDSVKRGFAKEGTPLVNDGAGLKIDNEVLIANQPDLVITTYDFSAQQKTAELCRDNGINALEIKEESFEDYLDILSLFAKLNGNDTAYQQYGLDVSDRIDVVKNRKHTGELSDYLFIRAGSAFSSTKIRKSEDHFACKIFNDLGASNVADTIGAITEEVSLENIITAQPDKIIIAPQGDEEASKKYIMDLFSEDGWNAVKAVKENQVYFVSKELFNYKPNQHWDESYEKAFEILYSGS